MGAVGRGGEGAPCGSIQKAIILPAICEVKEERDPFPFPFPFFFLIESQRDGS